MPNFAISLTSYIPSMSIYTLELYYVIYAVNSNAYRVFMGEITGERALANIAETLTHLVVGKVKKLS